MTNHSASLPAANSKTCLHLPVGLHLADLRAALNAAPFIGDSDFLSRRVCLLYCWLIRIGFSSKNSNAHGSDYTSINRRQMRHILGDGYFKVVERLVCTRFLERLEIDDKGRCDPAGIYRPANSSAGGRTKQYRIPFHLQFRAYLDPDNATIAQDLQKKFRLDRQPLTPKEQRILQQLATNKSRVSQDVWRDHVRHQMASTVILQDSPACRALLDALLEKGSITTGADDYLQIFNSLPRSTYVDSFGHRVHSLLTWSPKQLRPFLRFIDDPETDLVELDLVNAQPGIIAQLTPVLLDKLAPECNAAAPLLETAHRDPNFKKFQQLCEQGQLYEYLMDAYQRQYKEPINRKQAKKVFYVASFGNYRFYDTRDLPYLEWLLLEEQLYPGINNHDKKIDQHENNIQTQRAYELFRQEFPAVHALFDQLKRLKWQDLNHKLIRKPYSANCLLAQRVEAELVYGILVKALVEQGITRVLTIHDAILVRRSEAERALQILHATLREWKLNFRLEQK